MAEKEWICEEVRANLDMVANRYKIPKTLAYILVKRKLYSWQDMDAYLFPERKDIPSSETIHGMHEAVCVLEKKIREGKHIRIIGDYDVDGVASTYILIEGLKRCGAKYVSYRLPNRRKDGYGMRDYMAEEAKEAGVDTIVTCDNGISAKAAIAYAKELGLTVVLTDHHEVPVLEGKECIPPADVVLDLKQKADETPFKEICGAVLAWKLVLTLQKKMQGESVEDLIVFAALATVCDVMPLKKENRAIVRLGLEEMKKTKNIGLQALIRNFGFKHDMTSMTIGFQLGPCVNAAGRLTDASQALELFLCEDQKKADEMAQALLELNTRRKHITETATEAAVKEIEENEYLTQKVLIVQVPDCPESVAGIVAGRIRERYYRPTIVFSGENRLKGSGRSIPGYHMQQALMQCHDMLVEFGGHSQAAGMTIMEEQLDVFRKKMNEIADACLTPDDLIEKVPYDCELPLGDVDCTLVEMTYSLEPIGEENPGAIFVTNGIALKHVQLCGQNGTVGRLLLEEDGKTYYAVDFRVLDKTKVTICEKYGEDAWDALITGYQQKYMIDLMYTVEYNKEYNNISYQLQELR